MESHRTHTYRARATATKITSKGTSNLSKHPSAQRGQNFPWCPEPRDREARQVHKVGWGGHYSILLFPSLRWGQESKIGEIWGQTHTYMHMLRPQQRGPSHRMSGREAEAGGSPSVCAGLPQEALFVCSPTLYDSNVQSTSCQSRDGPTGIYMTDSFSQGSASPAGPG